jgi:hypothetical protein
VHHEVEAAGHNVAAAVDELKVSTGLSERVADEEARCGLLVGARDRIQLPRSHILREVIEEVAQKGLLLA